MLRYCTQDGHPKLYLFPFALLRGHLRTLPSSLIVGSRIKQGFAVGTRLGITILADISESTSFYEAVGDDRAQLTIQREIDRLREILITHGGVPVGQKGDDVLGYFEEHNAAVRAVLKMLSRSPGSALSVHAGLHYGPFVVNDGSIFGETVNLTARLAAAANPGEACISDSVAAGLCEDLSQLVRPIGALRLKGVSDPVDAYSLVSPEADLRTEVYQHTQTGKEKEHYEKSVDLSVVLYHDQRSWICREGKELQIGRSSQCDVVLDQPWVSRLHAILSLKDGKVLLNDRSSSGTFIRIQGGREIRLRREIVMLAGSGLISLALSSRHADARPLEFELVRR